MSLRMPEVDEVLRELAANLGGAVLQKAHVPLPKVAYLELRGRGESFLLCLCAEPTRARVSLAKSRFPSPSEPISFQVRLRQELLGARLLATARRGRAAFLEFQRDGGPHLFLVVEVGARGGGLLLLDELQRVIATSGLPKKLEHRHGEPYVPPPGALEQTQPSRLSPGPGLLPLSASAQALFGETETSARAEEIRRALLAPLVSRRARLLRTLEKVHAEANRGPQAEEHRRLGELLTQNLHQLKRGATGVRLVEYTAEGPIEVEVALDPALSPRDQAERHFRLYRRLLRGCEHAARRLVELSGELGRLEMDMARLQERTAEELLQRAELLLTPLPKKGAQPARPYKEFWSQGGARILVGKGAKANDALTFKIARPQDLWLHARGQPGAHVVVPLEKGASVDPQVLIDAAHLALHYSGAKGEPQGEVSYTQAKFVRRAPGAAPGQVSYTREKTIYLRVEAQRLSRLLEARDESSS